MGTYVVEYSYSQRAWHIDTLDSAITRNIDDMLEGRVNDYKIINMFGSYELANEWLERFIKELEKRK